jgi:hypothetical protein
MCLNLSEPKLVQPIKYDPYVYFNDEKIVSNDLNNYVLYNGQLKETDPRDIALLKIDDYKQNGKEMKGSGIRDENKIDLLLIDLSPIKMVFFQFREFIPESYWNNPALISKRVKMADINDNNIGIDGQKIIDAITKAKDASGNSIDIISNKGFYRIGDNLDITELKKSLKILLIAEHRLFYNDGIDTAAGKVIYELIYDDKKDSFGDIINIETGPKDAKIWSKRPNRDVLNDQQLIEYIQDSQTTIINIIFNRQILRREQLITYFADCYNMMPYCCNSACYRMARNELVAEKKGQPKKQDAIFVSIRQDCEKCDKMRNSLDENKPFTHGFVVIKNNGRTLFFKTMPESVKSKFCENANVELRNDKINMAFNGDDIKIEEFNSEIELKRSINDPTYYMVRGSARQQCPLNLIGDKWDINDNRLTEQQKEYLRKNIYLNGRISMVYHSMVSNCFEMDHISGSHTDNKASNIWTLCKICHAQKTRLGGDFGSGKDGVDKNKVGNISTTFLEYFNDFKQDIKKTELRMIADGEAIRRNELQIYEENTPKRIKERQELIKRKQDPEYKKKEKLEREAKMRDERTYDTEIVLIEDAKSLYGIKEFARIYKYKIPGTMNNPDTMRAHLIKLVKNRYDVKN